MRTVIPFPPSSFNSRSAQRVVSRPLRQAEVVPYPAARRRDRVERIARLMAHRSSHEANQHFLQEVEAIYFCMIKLGIDQCVAENDSIAFVEAVKAQVLLQFFDSTGDGA